jgi:hypothetical protein
MKRFVLLLTLAATTLAADCPGGDDGTGPDDNGNTSLVGTWTLQSLNGDQFPANGNDNGNVRVVTAGQIVVNANMSFTYTETVEGDDSDVSTGTCSLTTAPATYTCDPTENAGEPAQTNATAVVNGSSMTLSISESGTATTRVYSRN